MEEYKERFITEYNELAERQSKLSAIIQKHLSGTLDFTPTCPISLLQKQNRAMLRYLSILEERAEIESIKLN